MAILDWFHKIIGNKTIRGSDKQSSNLGTGLKERLNSSNSEERLSSLGVIINSMWSSDPKEQADAIKIVASAMFHDDIHMVHKAASGLSEQGAMGVRYLKLLSADSRINKSSIRPVILNYAQISHEPHRRHDLSLGDLSRQAQQVVTEAMKEVKYHNLSSVFTGKLPIPLKKTELSYVFDIDLNRQAEMQACISFQYIGSHMGVNDDVCSPIIKAFAQSGLYREYTCILSPLRYFFWEITSKYEMIEMKEQNISDFSDYLRAFEKLYKYKRTYCMNGIFS